jgi:hypothetical protein
MNKGFSILEGVIGMCLFLLIIVFCMECFSQTKKHFLKLKLSEESNTAVYAALDRMWRDIQDAGLGIFEPMKQEILEGVCVKDKALVVMSREAELVPSTELYAGQQRIAVKYTALIKKGKFICLFDSSRGEVHQIVSADRESIVLECPLHFGYAQERSKMVLMRRIVLYLDENHGVIRRKVNSSPAQPLLEEVAYFNLDYSTGSNLARISLKLQKNQEKGYEICVFPKNTAMASY